MNLDKLPRAPMNPWTVLLPDLLPECEFGELQTRMIQDQILNKCADPKLRKRLLGTPDLDFEKILTIARTTQSANDQAERKESKIESRNQERVNAAKEHYKIHTKILNIIIQISILFSSTKVKNKSLPVQYRTQGAPKSIN